MNVFCPNCGSDIKFKTSTPMYFEDGQWKVQKKCECGCIVVYKYQQSVDEVIYPKEKNEMIKQELDLTTLTNEELNLLVENLKNEKQRREKEKKYQLALNLRNALREFLDSGAECDYSMVYSMSGCDLIDLEVDNICDWYKDDLNFVEFDPFDSCLLREICNELTRSLGK